MTPVDQLPPEPATAPRPEPVAPVGPQEQGAPHRATQGSGVRALDPSTGQVVVVDPTQLHNDFVDGRLQLLGASKYAMIGPDGDVWEVPAAEVADVVRKGYTFATKGERVWDDANAPGAAWRAAADGAVNALPAGMGDAVQARLFQVDPDEIEARAKAHPIARGFGEAGGVALSLLLTGGAGLGGRAAGVAVEGTLAARGVSQGAAAIARAGVEAGVEGAVYGAGTALSEHALGRSDNLAESLLAHAGGGALMGGALGVGLRGLAGATRWGAAKTEARVEDFAAMVRRASGKEPPKGLPELLERAAKGERVDDTALELTAKELRSAFSEHLPPPLTRAQRAATETRLGALTPAGQAAAVDTSGDAVRSLFWKKGADAPDTARVFQFVKNLGKETNRSKEEAVEAWLAANEGSKAAKALSETLEGARTVSRAKQLFDGKLAQESAMGDAPVWMLRAAGYTAGGALGLPGGLTGLAAGALATRALRPAHAELQRAAIMRALSTVTERINGRASALVKGVGKVADLQEGSARLAAATAAMLGGDESARRKAFEDRVAELRNMADNPGAVADRLDKATAHLHEAVPDGRQQVIAKTSAALAYLQSVLPLSYQPDRLSDTPMTSAFERTKFGRIDAVLQDPLRVMERTATADEHKAVQTVFPGLYAEMRKAVAAATADAGRVSWATRRRLAALWHVETHEAFTSRHVQAMQASYQAAEEATPQAAPTPSPSRPLNEGMSETDQLQHKNELR